MINSIIGKMPNDRNMATIYKARTLNLKLGINNINQIITDESNRFTLDEALFSNGEFVNVDRRKSLLKQEIIMQIAINGNIKTGKLNWDGLFGATDVTVDGFPDNVKYDIEVKRNFVSQGQGEVSFKIIPKIQV